MSETRGRPFEPGNTAGRGRPPGSRNKNTLALQAILGDRGEALLNKCMLLAMQGNIAAMRLCIERLLPPLRDVPVECSVGPISTVLESGKALEHLVADIADGKLSPAEAQTIAEIIRNRSRLLESERVETELSLLDLVTKRFREKVDLPPGVRQTVKTQLTDR